MWPVLAQWRGQLWQGASRRAGWHPGTPRLGGGAGDSWASVFQVLEESHLSAFAEAAGELPGSPKGSQFSLGEFLNNTRAYR